MTNLELRDAIVERLPMPEDDDYAGHHSWWVIGGGRGFGACWLASGGDIVDTAYGAGEARKLCLFSFRVSAIQEMIGTSIDLEVEQGPYRLAEENSLRKESLRKIGVQLLIKKNGRFSPRRVFRLEDPSDGFQSGGRFSYSGKTFVEDSEEPCEGYLDLAGTEGRGRESRA